MLHGMYAAELRAFNPALLPKGGLALQHCSAAILPCVSFLSKWSPVLKASLLQAVRECGYAR